MTCRNCNHSLPEDSEFCQYCGNKIEHPSNRIEVIEESVNQPSICCTSNVSNPDKSYSYNNTFQMPSTTASKNKPKKVTKYALVFALVSPILILVLCTIHILAEASQTYIYYDIFYTIIDSMAFIILPLICLISLTIFVYFKFVQHRIYRSLTYREKCYKKVEKMQLYLEKGIISQEEFENNRRDITKNIKL